MLSLDWINEGAVIIGATSTTTGSPYGLHDGRSDHTLQLDLVSGTLTVISAVLEGSLDGNKWGTLLTLTSVTDGALANVSGFPAMYIRVRIATLTGTSPNVSLRYVGM